MLLGWDSGNCCQTEGEVRCEAHSGFLGTQCYKATSEVVLAKRQWSPQIITSKWSFFLH